MLSPPCVHHVRPGRSHTPPDMEEALAAPVMLSTPCVHHQVEAQAFAALAELRGIKKLDLSGLKLTDNIVGKILEGTGASLTSLSLMGCEQLTSRTVEAISAHCKQLTSLRLGELYLVATEAWLEFFTHADCARGLEEVRLERCHVTDDLVLALLLACGKSLRSLSLHSASEVTDVSLLGLAKFCATSLEHLDVSFCRKLTNEGLGHMTDSCLRLRTLALWGCSQVNEVFLEGHSRMGLVVRRGNVKGHASIKPAGKDKGKGKARA
jgi:DNA repair protein RAD7